MAVRRRSLWRLHALILVWVAGFVVSQSPLSIADIGTFATSSRTRLVINGHVMVRAVYTSFTRNHPQCPGSSIRSFSSETRRIGNEVPTEVCIRCIPWVPSASWRPFRSLWSWGTLNPSHHRTCQSTNSDGKANLSHLKHFRRISASVSSFAFWPFRSTLS